MAYALALGEAGPGGHPRVDRAPIRHRAEKMMDLPQRRSTHKPAGASRALKARGHDQVGRVRTRGARDGYETRAIWACRAADSSRRRNIASLQPSSAPSRPPCGRRQPRRVAFRRRRVVTRRTSQPRGGAAMAALASRRRRAGDAPPRPHAVPECRPPRRSPSSPSTVHAPAGPSPRRRPRREAPCARSPAPRTSSSSAQADGPKVPRSSHAADRHFLRRESSGRPRPPLVDRRRTRFAGGIAGTTPVEASASTDGVSPDEHPRDSPMRDDAS